MHVEKTGGSSVECATVRTLVQAGVWTNMGHTDQGAVSACAHRCPERQTFTVISIRDPYAYWASVYRYARFNRAAAAPSPGDMNFEQYIAWMAGEEQKPWWRRTPIRGSPAWSQSVRVRRACGEPCTPDFVLHTESLADDWAALLDTLQVPRYPLPHTNAVKAPYNGLYNTPFSRHTLDRINKMEAWFFRQFPKYTPR